MVSSKDILDAMVAARSRAGRAPQDDAAARSFLHDAIAAFGQRTAPARTGSGPRPSGPWGRTSSAAPHAADDGLSLEDLAGRAKEAIGRNPGLAQAALLGVGGLLLGSRQGRGLAGSLAGLGGVALITNLAYRAFERYQRGDPVLGSEPQPRGDAPRRGPIELHPTRATDADALLFVRAMIAAASADGHIDERERARVLDAFAQLGLDPEQERWLDQELAKPATPEELARIAGAPEKAAQTYAAARLAIEPDTAEERAFLRQLAQALKLDDKLKAEIDLGASGLKATA